MRDHRPAHKFPLGQASKTLRGQERRKAHQTISKAVCGLHETVGSELQHSDAFTISRKQLRANHRKLREVNQSVNCCVGLVRLKLQAG